MQRPMIVKVFYEHKRAIQNGDTEHGLVCLDVTQDQLQLLSDVGREWLASAMDRHGRLIDHNGEVLRVDSRGWVGVVEAIGRELAGITRDEPVEES